jgi:hypothetical protein
VTGLHPSLRLHPQAEGPDEKGVEAVKSLEIPAPELEHSTPRASWEGTTASGHLNRMSVLGVPKPHLTKSPGLDRLGAGNSPAAPYIESVDLTDKPGTDLMSQIVACVQGVV